MPTPIDIAKVRADTPGAEHVIHLNNAGASLPPKPVVNAQVEYLQSEAETGGYELADDRRLDIEDTYLAIAEMLGVGPDQIALTGNATEAWQLAFNSFEFGSGDRILTSEAEYASNYIEFLRLAQRRGVVIQPIPSDETGATSVAGLENLVDERVKLIAITHVPTNGGLINPAAEIGTVARRAGIPYLLDACQSVGQMDLSIEELGCDFLSATGRKFLRAPRGTGLLYVRPSIMEVTEPPVLDLHGAAWIAPDEITIRPDARRYETWEFNYAAVRGLGVATRYALDLGLAAIEERVQQLAAILRDLLAAIGGVTVRDLGDRKAGIVTFDHATVDAQPISAQLRIEGINSSTTGPASTLIDATHRDLPTLVRLSPHYYNTEAELEHAAAVISKIVAGG